MQTKIIRFLTVVFEKISGFMTDVCCQIHSHICLFHIFTANLSFWSFFSEKSIKKLPNNTLKTLIFLSTFHTGASCIVSRCLTFKSLCQLNHNYDFTLKFAKKQAWMIKNSNKLVCFISFFASNSQQIRHIIHQTMDTITKTC